MRIKWSITHAVLAGSLINSTIDYLHANHWVSAGISGVAGLGFLFVGFSQRDKEDDELKANT